MKKLNKYFTLLATTCFLLSCASGGSSSSTQSNSTLDSSTTESQITSSATPSSETSSATSSQASESSSSTSSQSSSQTSSVTPVTSDSTTQTSSQSSEELPAIDYVKVFADKTNYTHVYAWLDNKTELVGGWPGTKMNSYDDEWLTYDFLDHTSFNIIFNNNGKTQTADLKITHAGYYWCKDDTLYSTKPDDSGYIPPTDIPQGNYDIVESAATANDLPAVKNYNKGQVINPYTGSRTDFRDESIYFAMTTRFYDGDKSNNRQCWDGFNGNDDPAWRGDFKGLIEKMDYIKALGFTAIWITPVSKNASGYDYHGYHAINFQEVDPRYESEDVSFQKVINEAHSRDMKIILDVVFNHTCNFGEENLFPMFYYDSKNNSTIKGLIRNKDSGILDDKYDTSSNQFDLRIDAMKGPRDAYNIYHHEKNMAYEQYIEQTGQMAGDCVDLNTENPTVANYLVDSFGEFIRMGVDAFRIDTMKHISRLTFNNYIWPGLYKIAEKCGNNYFYMFGEVCTRVREVWNHGTPADSAPFYTWKERKDYSWGTRATNEASTLSNWNDNTNTTGQPTSQNAYLSGVNYHTPDHSKSSGCSVIDFPMHWNFQYARDAFRVAVENDKYYNDATYNVVYVDSHDYGPDCIEKVRYNMGESAWKENMSLMFTFRGVPCIYYGSEVQFQAGKTIDAGPYIALKDSGRAYYGDYLEGSVTASAFGEYTASGEVATTLQGSLCKHLMMLNKIRLKVPALRRGQYTTSNVKGDMAYTRRYTTNGIDSLACVAVSSGASFSSLPNGTYVDLVTGSRKSVTNGNLSISLSGQGNIAVYVLENDSTGPLSKI